jgi:hypothetical protein
VAVRRLLHRTAFSDAYDTRGVLEPVCSDDGGSPLYTILHSPGRGVIDGEVVCHRL